MEEPSGASSAQLAVDGFVFLRSAVNEELVRALLSDVEHEIELALGQAGQLSQCEAGWFSPSGALFGDSRGLNLTQVQLTYRTSAAMLQAALAQMVLDALEGVIGPNIELFGEGQAFVKMPSAVSTKHMHQDDAFFVHREKSQYAALIYLDDVDAHNGALELVRGSHLAGALPHGPSSSHLAASESRGESDSVVLAGGAGDVVVFHGLTLHGSGPNRSAKPRVVAVNRYRRAGDTVVTSQVTAEGQQVTHEENGQEGLVVRGHRSLQEAPGWAWPIFQQRVFPV